MKRLMIRLCLCLTILMALPLSSQEAFNSTLLKADKLYIKRDYEMAVLMYLKYLEKYPRDYYAERQTAICFNKLNRPDDAIDHWPIVVESSEATEKDYLEFGRSLLANNRGPEAKKVFMVLSRSTNKSMAAWGKMYINPSPLFIDSASTKVREVTGINTETHEYSPLIFKEKMFYVSDKARSLRLYYSLSDLEGQNIGGALKKDSLSLFPTVIYEKLHALNINGPFCFSPDGSLLYFCKSVSNKDLNVKSQYPFYKFQLFTLTMSTLNNLEPEIKKFRYNTPDHDFMHPCLSRDGKRLYFVSDMKGSSGGKDIFMCELVNGNWGPPVNAGQEVNSPGNEVFPHLAEDGSLYFASDHRPGLGGLDIFRATVSGVKGKIFEEAENVGANINSRFDDFGIFIVREGKGYLSSNRKNGTDDDIYYFTDSRK